MVAQLKSHVALLKTQATDRESKITRLTEELSALKLEASKQPPALTTPPARSGDDAKEDPDLNITAQRVVELTKNLEETRGRVQAEQMVSYTLRRRVCVI